MGEVSNCSQMVTLLKPHSNNENQLKWFFKYLLYISNIFLGLESVYGWGLLDFSPFWIFNGCLNSCVSFMSEIVFFLLM